MMEKRGDERVSDGMPDTGWIICMHVCVSGEGVACADYTSVMLIGHQTRGFRPPSLSPAAGSAVIGAEGHAEMENRAAAQEALSEISNSHPYVDLNNLHDWDAVALFQNLVSCLTSQQFTGRVYSKMNIYSPYFVPNLHNFVFGNAHWVEMSEN